MKVPFAREWLLLAVVLAGSWSGARPAVAADGPLFSAPYLFFDAGCTPQVLGQGDFDRDGSMDLISACGVQCGSLLLGRGDGLLDAPTRECLLAAARCIAVADLDKNGTLDFVAGSLGVEVVRGDGSGNFALSERHLIPDAVTAIAIEDLDRDGWPDIIYTFAAESALSVLRGGPNGRFTQGADTHVPEGLKHLAVRDLNGDDVPDAAVTVAESSLVTVLIGRGDGGFSPGSQHSVSGGSEKVAIGDLNGDGIADLAVANPSATSISTLMGLGGGDFGAASSWPTVSSPGDLAIEDLNADGRDDVVALGSRSAVLSVFLADSEGKLPMRTDYPVGRDELRSVVIGDLNGDGKPDLAVGVESRANVSVLLGQGDGTFGIHHKIDVGNDPLGIVAAHLDADGLVDLAVNNRVSSTVSIMHGLGGGRFGSKVDIPTRPYPVDITAQDLNADGVSDLAITYEFGVEVFQSDGTGGFLPATDYPLGRGATGITTGDVNGDAISDIVVAVQSRGSLMSLLGQGDGSFPVTMESAVGYLAQSSIVAADFNADRHLDVAIARTAIPGYITLVLGKGDGTFGGRQDIPTSPGDNPREMATGDLNADGRPDLVAANILGGTVTVLLGNGDGSFVRAPTIQVTPRKGVFGIGIGDLDGDGMSDLAIGSAGGALIMRGNGDGTFETMGGYGTISYPASFAFADFDEDCLLDFAAVQWGDAGPSAVWVFTRGTGTVPVLRATATMPGDSRVIPVGQGPPFLCVRIQPGPDDFLIGDVDPETIVMRSEGTGSLDVIHAVSGEWTSNPEAHQNRTDVFEACWAREDLARLFSGVRGHSDVMVWIEGCLVGSGRFRAPLTLRLLGIAESARAGVQPNPLNPNGILRYSTSRPGPVRIRVYSLFGRLLSTLLDEELVPGGRHEVPLGGTFVRDVRPASGVYFYRVDTVDGTSTGRFTVLK